MITYRAAELHFDSVYDRELSPESYQVHESNTY
jgi:hypothetical protein